MNYLDEFGVLTRVLSWLFLNVSESEKSQSLKYLPLLIFGVCLLLCCGLYTLWW